MQKISEYANERTSLIATDRLDVSADLGGGSWESQHLQYSTLTSNLFGTVEQGGAFTSLGASTAALAAMNFDSGVDKAAPVDGDLWWNGTNLYFRDGVTSVDLLDSGVAGTTINPTDLYLPSRQDGTTFVDSLLSMTATAGEMISETEKLIFKAAAVAAADSIRLLTEADGTMVYAGLTGGLFSIIDDKDNELWTASDVSGNPIGYIDADWSVRFGNPFARPIDVTYNNGTGTSVMKLGNADPLRKGIVSIDGLHYNTNITTLATAGTPNIDLTHSITKMTSSGIGETVGVEDGEEGQELTLIYEAEGGGTDTVLVQPLSTIGFTTITFADVGEGAVLLFTNSAWMVKAKNGTTLS